MGNQSVSQSVSYSESQSLIFGSCFMSIHDIILFLRFWTFSLNSSFFVQLAVYLILFRCKRKMCLYVRQMAAATETTELSTNKCNSVLQLLSFVLFTLCFCFFFLIFFLLIHVTVIVVIVHKETLSLSLLSHLNSPNKPLKTIIKYETFY